MFPLLSQNVSYSLVQSQDDRSEVSEKLNSKIDLNMTFTDEAGNTKTIREMFAGQSTLIITFNYFRCTTMCTYQFLNLSESLQQVGLPVGKGYAVASISFDPTDTSQRAQTTRDIWLTQLGQNTLNTPWHFYVSANSVQTQKLTDSLNFYFQADEDGNYSHTAGLFFINKDGTFSRYLYGIVYNSSYIKYALIDTSHGAVGNFFDKLKLKFFKYNQQGKYDFFLM